MWDAVRPRRGGDRAGEPPVPPRTWRNTVVGAHVFAAVVFALAVVSGILDGDDSGRSHAALGAVIVLAVGYAVLGGPAIAGPADRRAVAYLVLLVAAVSVVAWGDPGLLFLLTVAYPQVWFLVEDRRTGLVWTFLLAAGTGTGLAVGLAQTGGSPFQAVADLVIGMLFSIALGYWMSRVLEQSRQRATLIEELESTRAQLAEAHHGQGVMAERERLAREVHDTLAQGYTSVVVLAQTARAELSTAPERAAERLELIEEVARDNLRETRAVVAAFAPVPLDGSTLVEALHRLADRFGRETGVDVRVETFEEVATGGADLSRADEIVLLRAAQEALSNARRHASATHITLSLGQEDGDMVVRVHDDGVGFDPAADAGTGLAGLRSRVEQAGGALLVRSGPGQGTRLEARLPVAG